MQLPPLHWKGLVLSTHASMDDNENAMLSRVVILLLSMPRLPLITFVQDSHTSSVTYDSAVILLCGVLLSISTIVACIHNFLTMKSLPYGIVNPYRMHDGVSTAIAIIISNQTSIDGYMKTKKLMCSPAMCDIGWCSNILDWSHCPHFWWWDHLWKKKF